MFFGFARGEGGSGVGKVKSERENSDDEAMDRRRDDSSEWSRAHSSTHCSW